MKGYKFIFVCIRIWVIIGFGDFAYSQPPIINSVTVSAPGSGMSGYVGCKIILRGIGFSNVKKVYINKIPVPEFTFVNDNCITFKAIAFSGIINILTVAGSGAYFGTEYKDLGYCLPGSTYAVEGGGKVCNTSTSVGLSNSQQGFVYRLFCNGEDTGKSLTGTGEPIIFEDLVNPGKYTMMAVNLKCGLQSEMTGSALIEEQKGIILYMDADNDGYGSSSSYPKKWCDAKLPQGYVNNNLDCDDSNPAISPEAVEILGNNIDDNCDGIIDGKDIVDTQKPFPPSNRKKGKAKKTGCYPNPFNKTFWVAIAADSDATVKIYDVVGKMLDMVNIPHFPETQTFEFGGSYPSGVYKVIVIMGKKQQVFQIVKR